MNPFDTNVPRDLPIGTENYNDFLTPQDVNSGLMIGIARSIPA